MKYIFDVDGTLTPSRQVIDPSFEAFMIKFCCKHDVYLVTGSDRQKTVDQLGLDICYRAKRVYNCSGADVWEKNENIYRSSCLQQNLIMNASNDESITCLLGVKVPSTSKMYFIILNRVEKKEV